RLLDSYGDNGLVSAICGIEDKDEVRIDVWVMSCRVFKRDLEFAVFDHFVSQCLRKGMKRILGIYRASSKNKIVSDLYSKLGFKKIDEEKWILENLHAYRPLNEVIQLLGSDQ